jgi:hypothetical protein
MRLLIIASWYPNHYSDIEGGFIRDQAVAVKREHPDWQVYVSYAEPHHLKVFRPLDALGEIKSFIGERVSVSDDNGVVV